MDRDPKAYLKDRELTEADRVVLGLYERAAEPIEWDESDEAILELARGIHAEDEGEEQSGSLAAGAAETPADDQDLAHATETDEKDSGSNVVAFAQRKRPTVGRAFYRSPIAGFSIAASLMVGVFAGQGLTPYVNFGLAPDYDQIIEENQQLTRSLLATRSIRIREPQPAAGQEPAVAPESDLKQISTILDGFACANLSMTLSRKGEIRVSGHVSNPEDLGLLRSSLSDFQQLGRVTEDVLVNGWPICEVLEILGSSTAMSAGTQNAPVVRPFNHGSVYVGGESLIVEAQGTGLYDAYLYIDFVQNDGNVLHMLPFDRRPDNKVGPGERILLGADDVQYALAAPYGTEMLMIIASPVPLFEVLRAEVEPAQSYFKDLGRALERLTAEGHGSKILSAYHILTTKAE